MDEHRLYVEEQEMREEQLIRAQVQNTENIALLSTTVQSLTESTQGLVDTWVVANALNKFLKWAASLGVLGGLLTWAYNKISGVL